MGAINLPDNIVDKCLIKEKKTIQEMIDTCPENRTDTLLDYKSRMEIVKEYAPQMITNPEEIKKMITAAVGDMELSPANRGAFMKTVMPTLKGKVNMKIANQIITDMFKENK